jgi:hypothetical protein
MLLTLGNDIQQTTKLLLPEKKKQPVVTEELKINSTKKFNMFFLTCIKIVYRLKTLF